MKNQQLQMDLLAATEVTPILAAEQKVKIVSLIEALLKEVAVGLPSGTQEASDDEDRS